MEQIAWISLGVAFLCALIIAIDEARRPQKMAVMNLVWPVSALYGSVFALWAYYAVGRAQPKSEQKPMNMEGNQDSSPPTFRQTALAASHCGAGCVLSDIVAEFTVFGLALTVAGNSLFASFLWDYVLAWTVGVAIQYFTIKPMRHLTVGGGILAAIKADTLSITAFQVGMYGWMALVFYRLGPHPHWEPNQPQYWLSMQVAMLLGFATALPMNYFLIRAGLKEKMN